MNSQPNKPHPISLLSMTIWLLGILIGIFRSIGKTALQSVVSLGRSALFVTLSISHLLRPPFYLRETTTQLVQIGWLSLPVIGLTALFTGAALALQIYSGGQRFNAESVVPSIVAIGMVRELGPVLGGLMVAARVTSSIAAELGTMKVTEQVDALITLSTNPFKYLVIPRLVAATLAVPALVGIGDTIGIMGGWLTGINQLGFNSTAYLSTTIAFLERWDVISGLMKGAIFGFIIAITGCYYGLNSERGARGVGQATKSAVVMASVLILGANYVLTEAFFTK